jgi:hypothetical protein
MQKANPSFKDWTTQQIEKTFGLLPNKKLPSLQQWVADSAMIVLPETMQERAEELLATYEDKIAFWSEETLKMKLIGPLLVLAKIDNDKYAAYAGLKINAKVLDIHQNPIKMNGEPDLVIATGKYEPELPYFCLCEYKKQRGYSNDPQGQVLASMLAARELNILENNPLETIYGSYVMGKEWIFCTLTGNEYAVTKAYIVNQKTDLEDILKILSALKNIITTLAK